MDVNVKKAELLASKFDKLNAHFDIVESTIDECTDYINSTSKPIVNNTQSTVVSNNITPDEILSYMREDFLSARSSLSETITSGREVITSLTAKLTLFDDDSVDAELVSSYANLIKATNEGAKLLMGMYTDIIKLQNLSNKKDKDKTGINIEGDITVNSISGNIADIIKQIKGSDNERF